jgi:hypothetical protein
MELAGRIVKKPFGIGSKSERQAIYLVAPSGEYVLRRPGANPFEIDQELAALVGNQVQCSGVLSGYTFFVSDWKILNPTNP